ICGELRCFAAALEARACRRQFDAGNDLSQWRQQIDLRIVTTLIPLEAAVQQLRSLLLVADREPAADRDRLMECAASRIGWRSLRRTNRCNRACAEKTRHQQRCKCVTKEKPHAHRLLSS